MQGDAKTAKIQRGILKRHFATAYSNWPISLSESMKMTQYVSFKILQYTFLFIELWLVNIVTWYNTSWIKMGLPTDCQLV